MPLHLYSSCDLYPIRLLENWYTFLLTSDVYASWYMSAFLIFPPNVNFYQKSIAVCSIGNLDLCSIMITLNNLIIVITLSLGEVLSSRTVQWVLVQLLLRS